MLSNPPSPTHLNCSPKTPSSPMHLSHSPLSSAHPKPSLSSPSHLRLSPQVRELRKQLPYYNYGSTTHAHPVSEVQAPRNNWTGPRGYGGRHKLDDATFSLWDEVKGDFRIPEASERKWLITRYNPSAICFQFPVMIIETSTPPDPLPLTVAGVATKFIPPPSPPVTRNTIGMGPEPIPDARPIEFTTLYAGRRTPGDPLDFKFKKWTQPSEEEQKKLVEALSSFCNPRLVHILCPRIIVELHCDGRTYEPGSMPRKIGGYSVHYNHQTASVFEGLCVQARQRLISPTPSIQDTSDYLQVFDELCPGVRVCSETFTDSASGSQCSMSTTAGLLVRDNHGHQRLTVSNHGFLHGKEVFHPSDNGTQIGEIEERWEHLDIALVKMNPSIHFTNRTYFDASVPRRLLRSREIPEGTFFAVDGISTGVVFMQVHGLTLAVPKRPDPPLTEIPFSLWKIFRSFGASGVVPREGICGAALVENDTEEGGVAGFFQNGNADYALSPCLDEFIDRSWSLV